MKILVIGASGRVGNRLTEKLLEKEHTVVGTTRKEKKLFDAERYSQIGLDLSEDLDKMEAQIPDGLDAIYFVSGSRGKDLLQTDLDGAVKSMQLAEKKNIGRYIMLSAAGSLSPEKWNSDSVGELKDYLVAKHYADLWLMNNTELNYTILQPGALKEKEGSGKIEVNVDQPGENAIENVAETLMEIVGQAGTSKKVISMQDGSKPIKEALASL